MKFEAFLKAFSTLPVIESVNVRHVFSNNKTMGVQLTRWVKQQRLIRLKRGVYLFSELYRKGNIFEPYIASALKRPSYLSLEKALEYSDWIPEGVGIYTCITSKRPDRFRNPLGVFDYKHLRTSLFWGYKAVTLNGQTALIALPEKALLDLIYFTPGSVSVDYLEGLRLQNLNTMKLGRLMKFARRFQKPKMAKAAQIILEYAKASRKSEKVL